MSEQLANVNYIAWGVQPDALTAVIPDKFLFAIEQSANTQMNWDKVAKATGTRSKVYHTHPGIRTHEVAMKYEGTPNATLMSLAALLKKTAATTGTPLAYTKFDDTGSGVYLTVDIAKGPGVERYIGVRLAELELFGYEDNGAVIEFKGPALKSLISRRVASISGTSITLKSDGIYLDPAKGFVANDLVRSTDNTDGSAVTTTISSVIDETTVVVASATGIAVGDIFYLRPQTITVDTQVDVFEWATAEFYVADTHAAALALTKSSMQPAKEGTSLKIMNDFEDDKGAQRSGSRDPAALVNTQNGIEFKLNRYFDSRMEYDRFCEKSTRGIVARFYGPTVAGAAAVATTQRAVASNIATLTTATHAIVPGQRITVSGMTDATYNGTFTVLTTPDTTHLTYALTHADEAQTADTAGTVTALPTRTQMIVNIYNAKIDTYDIPWTVGEIVDAEITYYSEPNSAGKGFDVEITHEIVGF